MKTQQQFDLEFSRCLIAVGETLRLAALEPYNWKLESFISHDIARIEELLAPVAEPGKAVL